MMKTMTINATKARNNFFNLLEAAYWEKQQVIIKKNNIPMAKLVPVASKQKASQSQQLSTQAKQNLRLLRKLKKIQQKMPVTANSVGLIKEMRQDG